MNEAQWMIPALMLWKSWRKGRVRKKYSKKRFINSRQPSSKVSSRGMKMPIAILKTMLALM